jgi:hypothetical protein
LAAHITPSLIIQARARILWYLDTKISEWLASDAAWIKFAAALSAIVKRINYDNPRLYQLVENINGS